MRYRGIKRDGTHVVGSATHEPAEFIEKRFEQGWRSLVVEADTSADFPVVGEITVLDGKRTWWAENMHSAEPMGDER